MQHVNVKIFASQADIQLVDAIAVFHRWIQDNVAPELLIDVADYKHVPDGPGIMLIGHEADYSLDETDGRLGLLYNRKVKTEGGPQAALGQAFDAALTAARRLESEPAFAGRLKFDDGDVRIIINDRLIAPNTDETWDAYRPEIAKFFAGLYGEGRFAVERRGDLRERFTVDIRRTA